MPTPSPDDLIPLPQLLRELRNAADILDLEREALNGVTYDRARGAILDGLMPAEKHGREWKIRRKDLPAVVSVLGLGVRRGPGRPRKAVSPSNAVAAA